MKKHQKVALVIENKKVVRLKTPCYPTIASLRGAAGRLERRLSWDEMRTIAREDHWKAETKKRHRSDRIPGIKRAKP